MVPEDKKQLKKLLDLLEENLFSSILSETKYVTNSKKRIG